MTSQTLLCDHHTSIVLYAYGLVLLKPFTIVDKNNHSAINVCLLMMVVFGQHNILLYEHATENHCANPLPVKATVSETTGHDPPPHNKPSQMPTPTTTLLFTTIESG